MKLASVRARREMFSSGIRRKGTNTRHPLTLRGVGQSELSWTPLDSEDYDAGYFQAYGTLPDTYPTSVYTGSGGDSFNLPDLNKLYDFAARAGSTVLDFYQQKELNDINLERAKRGQAPLDVQMYKAQAAPRVNVALAPDQEKLLIYGGIGLLAIMFLSRKKS